MVPQGLSLTPPGGPMGPQGPSLGPPRVPTGPQGPMGPMGPLWDPRGPPWDPPRAPRGNYERLTKEKKEQDIMKAQDISHNTSGPEIFKVCGAPGPTRGAHTDFNTNAFLPKRTATPGVAVPPGGKLFF